MARASVMALLAVSALLVSAATAQTCDDELPAQLAGNYSGLACRPVWNNFVLRYAQDKNNVLRVVLSTMYSTGWVGMGFSKDGLMVGSSAMVGWMGKTGVAHIKQFSLRGKAPSQVVVDQGFLVSNDHDHTVLVQQAKIYLAFELRFTEPLKQQNVLLAFGSAIPVNDRLSEHEDKTSIKFDFTTGSSSTSSSFPEGLKRTHGILNLFAWGVLLPIGAIVARYCRRWDPLWFYLHAGVQFVGFILGLAGIVVGVSLYSRIQANVPAHRGLGIFVLVLGILQILAFFLRPKKDSKYRKFWNWYHHWVGRLALFFAAINIVLGIKVGGAGNSWKIGYGFNLAILLITIITLEVLLWTRWKNSSNSSTTY
ncbi:cytochrome b561 and DOMON domain-containing protein At3g61750-like [Phragmites australis]|uniref:cytochrome b561 and DOMON domain-containing protein At3g61750-like n=1 Tax=Phragmites australis TaxID=29695 RepID=UPI002D7892AB|nr:cytochrome b561 and DOMON domain-containing protein At3g61750-like [Phragmites australis]